MRVPLARELRKVLVERLGTKLEATMSQGQKFERPKNRPVLIEVSHRIVCLGLHHLLAVMLPTVIETRIRREKVN